MDLLWTILLTLLLGLLAGLIARALVPGKDAMSLPATALLGIVGSLLGGAVWGLIQDGALFTWPPQTGGLLLSILGAIVALLIYNRVAASRNKTV